MDLDQRPHQAEKSAVSGQEIDSDRLIVQICLSAIVLLAAMAVLLFGTGDPAGTTLAAGSVGLIFGRWMR
jgi:hypothetical protein